MAKNTAVKTMDKTKETNLKALDFYFDFEPEFVFGYSPDDLRAVCEASEEVAHLFVMRLGELLASTPDTQPVERIGFMCPLSDHEWLEKMMTLAQGLDTFNYDADECCYAELDAVRQARSAAKEARSASDSKKNVLKGKRFPESENATDGAKKQETKNQDETEYFLQGFRKGQLQISNFITRSQVLHIGARGKGRRLWTADAPLIIRDVSGFKPGDIKISYVGQELRPADIHIWAKVLLMTAASPLGTQVTINRAQLLKARGGGDSSNSADAAEAEIKRLQGASFRVTIRCLRTIDAIAAGCPDDNSIQDAKKTGILELSFHLLGQTTTSGRLWTIQVEPVVRLLFGKGISSWFEEAVYTAIRGDFAKRLYLLYYSHTDCYPLTLADLRRYLGSTMAEKSDFQDAVDAAHAELARTGVICDDWKLEKSARRHNAIAYVVTRAVRKVEAETTNSNLDEM
jgi:hypothetical protein